ncbi:MAG: hypothetical protein WC770_05990 [Phycisphaerae bacterium]|jgi:hypothetical protein
MNSKGISLKSLEANLRSFSDIDVPQGLKAKILAAIPCEVQNSRKNPDFRWFKFWTFGFGTSAAALFVVGTMMIFKTSTLSTTQMFVADPIDMPRCFITIDQNNSGTAIRQLFNEPNIIN